MSNKPFLIFFILLAFLAVAGGDSGQGSELDYSKLSGIIIPGFASTQLRAWSILDCPYSPLDFNPLDLVWLDTTKLLSAVNCWLKCMLLDPYNQTDHPDCKSRPDSGLSGITELDPGYITGPLSSVWKEWIKWCIEFGIEANAIIAVPYDWRLSPSMLEERDLYFHKLKLTFETAFKLRGGPSLVFGHSLGNNVFRYFLEWLKLEIAPKHYIQWLDQHIHAYFAVAAPLLGATETIEATLSGFTFGLPVSEGTARLMFNSFASSLWMMPFSKYCRASNKYWKHFSGGKQVGTNTYHCDEEEFKSNFSGWPTKIINIEIPSTRGFEAYPSFSEIPEANLSGMECGLPTQLSFSAREIADGSFFKAIAQTQNFAQFNFPMEESWENFHLDMELGCGDDYFVNDCNNLNIDGDDFLREILLQTPEGLISSEYDQSDHSFFHVQTDFVTVNVNGGVEVVGNMVKSNSSNSIVSQQHQQQEQEQEQQQQQHGLKSKRVPRKSSSPKTYILSFDNSTMIPATPEPCVNLSSRSKRSRESTQKAEVKSNQQINRVKKGRSSSQCIDHIMAERKRRQELSEKFIALSATIPGLSKVNW